jgi:hypothetical protein
MKTYGFKYSIFLWIGTEKIEQLPGGFFSVHAGKKGVKLWWVAPIKC